MSPRINIKAGKSSVKTEVKTITNKESNLPNSNLTISEQDNFNKNYGLSEKIKKDDEISSVINDDHPPFESNFPLLEKVGKRRIYAINKREEETKTDNPLFSENLTKDNWLEEISKNKYVDPDLDKKYNYHGTKKERKLLFPFIGSIVGGILTGLAFGAILLFFILPLLADNQKKTNNLATEQQRIDNTNQTTNSPTQPMTESDLTYYLLQAGVFYDHTGLEKIMNDVKALGYPAIATEDSPYRLYVGISANKEDAQNIAQGLKEQGIDIYVKTYMLPQPTNSDINNNLPNLSNWLLSGEKIKNQFIDFANQKKFNNSEVNGLEVYTNLQKEIQNFVQEGLMLQQNSTGETQTTINKMITSINIANNNLAAYNKEPSAVYLTNIQEAILQYLLLSEMLIK